jgi:hypothetical protein
MRPSVCSGAAASRRIGAVIRVAVPATITATVANAGSSACHPGYGVADVKMIVVATSTPSPPPASAQPSVRGSRSPAGRTTARTPPSASSQPRVSVEKYARPGSTAV